ncbi:MAG: hypothetical protein J6U54_03990 [Clostridiales bacterium]|nr:hypothetical protein [Clostridiales bacterium]
MTKEKRTWTYQEISDDVLKLHQQHHGYKPTVLEEVKAETAWFVETLAGKDFNLLPFEMNVMEFGQDRRVLGVRIYDGHFKLLVKIAHDFGDNILSVEDDIQERFLKVKISTSDPKKIVNMIAKMRLKTTVKIKLQSKPEVRMVQKAVAYKRDAFMVQVIDATVYKTKKKDKITGQETEELKQRVKYKTEPMGEGTFARRLEMQNAKTRLQCENGGSRIFINGSDMFTILKMNVRNEEMLPFADAMLNGIYLIRSKGVRNGISIGYEFDDGKERCVQLFGQSIVRNGKETKDAKLTMEHIEDGIKKGKVLKYKPFPQSPSMTRTQSVLMVNVTHNTIDEMIDMINKASYGSFKVMLAAYSGKPLPAEKAIKKISRLSLTMTGGAKFGNIENFAFFMGDLEVFGSSFHDGQGFLAAETIQKWLSAKGIVVPLEECFKYSNQGRFGTVKGFNLSVPRWTMNEVIDYLLTSGIAKKKIYIDKTLEQAIDIERNENGKYNKCILIYGDEDELDYFGDSTNVKCMFDLSQEIEYSLMDLPVEPKGHIVTSRQVCNVAQTQPQFLPIFVALAKETIDHILKSGLGDTDTRTDELEYEGVETHKDISQSNFAADILTQLIPEIDKLDRTVRRIKYKGIIDALNRVANRFNFRVKGINCKIVGDLAGWFGARLLDKQEVFTITMKSTNGLLKAIAIRHPLCGIGEHLPVAFVGVQELIDRLPNAKRENGTLMTERQQEAVAVWVKYLMPGIAMLASTFAFVAAYFSGADFDGDMVSFFLEERLVALFLSMPLYYVLFGGHNTGKDKFKFNYNLIAHSFRYQYAIGGGTVNPSIGRLAGYNVTVLGLIYALLTDQVSPIWVRNQLRPIVNGVQQVINVEVKGNYKRAYLGNVNFEGKEDTFINDFLLAVSKAGNTKEEVLDILLDLNVIISKCMNDIIDAAKSGDKVEVPFMTLLEGRIRSGAVAVDDYGKIELMKGDSTELQPLQLSIGEMPKGIKESPFKTPFKYDDDGVLVFQDALVELRNETLKYAYQMVKEALSSSISDPFGAYETCDEELKGVLDMFSSQFVDMMEGKMTDRKSAKIAIVDMARTIARKYSPVKDHQLVFEARLASYYTNKKTKKLDSNSFYLAFVHEIATYFIEKYCPDKMFTSRVYKNGGGYGTIGQKIEFENGFSKDGFYCETPVTGTYTLEVSNHGNAVIRRPVKEMIPEKTMSNIAFVEISNIGSVKGIPNRKAEDIMDIVESARSGDSTFKFAYVNDTTGEVTANYRGTHMCILIDGKPTLRIRTPQKGSYFARYLYGKTFKVTQTELGERNKTDVIYLLGELV